MLLRLPSFYLQEKSPTAVRLFVIRLLCQIFHFDQLRDRLKDFGSIIH